MTRPDPNADFVEQILDAVRQLHVTATSPVTDVEVVQATALHLPTVRAVLAEEDGKAVRVLERPDDGPWRVEPV